MGFGGLLLAYAMLRVWAASWPDPATRFDRPLAAALTFVLLFSGATMTAAVAMARARDWRGARLLTWVTALAGMIFVAGQAVEFRALVAGRQAGNQIGNQIGLTTDHAAALFYVITGYHGLHVLAGVIALAMVAGRAGPARLHHRERPSPSAAHAPSAEPVAFVRALDVLSLYWQFVDLVWVVIFTLIYLLPPGAHG
jgi:heme/copper-type cytochrome/quinol oxidase subunit 3